MAWTSTLADARELVVTLRVVVPANVSSSVLLRAPSLAMVAPATGARFSWEPADGADGSSWATRLGGAGVRDVRVRAALGEREAEARATVLVLPEAPRLHGTIGGSLVALLPEGVDGQLAWGPENGTKQRLAAAPQVTLPSPSAGETYALLLDAGSGREVLLARVRAEDPQARPIPEVVLATRLPSPLTGVRVRALVPDPDAREVVATLLDAKGREVSRAVLAPLGGGVYEGKLPVRGATLLAEHAVAVIATDGAGRAATASAGPAVRVTPLANLDVLAAPVLAFLLVCVVGAAVGVARIRRGA